MLLVLLQSVAVSSVAYADGNEAHGEVFHRAAVGLGLTSTGVGLSARRGGATPPMPLTEGSLVLSAIPSGATVVQAYLYWVVYGSAGDDSVNFGITPTPVTGSLIGTSAHTCWDIFDTTELNRAYRADVTERVTGNGTYLMSGFPSADTVADTQGASLVVIFTDPASTTIGTVVLNDGAITASGGTPASTFANVVSTSSTQSATFRLGTGDGQGALSDGTLRFSGTLLAPPMGGHFGGTAGLYWDDRSYDVTTLIDPLEANIPWGRTGGADCVVFVYAALSVSSVFVDEDGDGIENAFDNCLGLINPEQADADSDRVGDLCDNCINRANRLQNDRDGDRVGDTCDNCNELPNFDQLNSDTDTWGNLCDNCPDVANASQIDSDGDGIGDPCEDRDGGVVRRDAMASVPDAAIRPADASMPARDSAVIPAADAASPSLDALSGGPTSTPVPSAGCGCRVVQTAAPNSTMIVAAACIGLLALIRPRARSGRPTH